MKLPKTKLDPIASTWSLALFVANPRLLPNGKKKKFVKNVRRKKLTFLNVAPTVSKTINVAVFLGSSSTKNKQRSNNHRSQNPQN